MTGPAARDLLAEDRDHAAGRAEHVAEADAAEPRLRVVAMAPALDEPFAERLRLAHHRLRVHGLVGRDEHEPLRAELDRDVRDGTRAEGVVAHGLERVRLHQRHVLVRRRVEDDCGPVLVEDLAHLHLVAGVGEHRGGRVEDALVDELALDLEQPGLGVVDEHEPRRADARDLAAELGADRAAGARDEHDLAGQVAGDRVEVDLDRLAPEQVLDLDRADLAREVEVRRDQLARGSAGSSPERLRRGRSRRCARAPRPERTESR